MKSVAAQNMAPYRVLLATPYGEDGMGGIDRLNDAIVAGINSRPEMQFVCDRLVTRGKGNLLGAQAVFAAALGKFIGSAALGRVDLLHIHLSVRGSSLRKAILARTARTLKVPYVVHLHGTDYREFWDAAPAPLKAEICRMFALSEGVIVLGTYWATVVREIEPASSSKITVLPNATAPPNPEFVKSETNAPVRITFLGQLGSRKGSPDLIDALARLSTDVDWMATIAGDGAIAEARTQVKSLGIGDKVFVPGWLSTKERTALLEQTDILVLPSYAENLPMVLLEAFAHGIATVVTPVGAIPEVVTSGHNGILVQPGDVEALSQAIQLLVKDPALRRRLGAAAREDHENKFEISQYLKRLSNVWQSVRSRRKSEGAMPGANL